MALPILLVDDDPFTERDVAAILGKRGYKVHTVKGAEAALSRAAVLRPALVLISDPLEAVGAAAGPTGTPGGIDAFWLLRGLRAHPELLTTPVVILASAPSDEQRLRALRLGAADYLAKPFRFEELDLRLAAVMERVKPPPPGMAPPPSSQSPLRLPGGIGSSAPLGIHGSLEQLGLGSLLAMLEMEKKSGLLLLQRGSDTAQLHCQDGKVCAARLELDSGTVVRGVDAVSELLTWESGQFDFTRATLPVEDEIATPTTHLLMEAARRIDETRAESD